MTANPTFPAQKSDRRAKSAPQKGVFITFEGGEGAGKSTQIKRLAAKLEDHGREVVVTREPGGSPGAEAVRHVLLSGAAEHLGPEMEAVLFSAARSDHVDTVIRPALEDDAVVLCDRFFDSTRVYQGITGDVDMNLLKQLEVIACEKAWPDLTIIIDVEPDIGMRRANSRRAKSEQPDRFEKETLEKQVQRRNAYLQIAESEPDRCHVVDGNSTPARVFQQVWKAVQQRLGEKLGLKGSEKSSRSRRGSTGQSRSNNTKKTD